MRQGGAMTNLEINMLVEALQKQNDDAQKECKRVFRNKSCRTIMGECFQIMEKVPNKEGNMILMTVIRALLFVRKRENDALRMALEKYQLIDRLYGAMCHYLSGKSQRMSLRIEWNDHYFPNKYEFVSRFTGQFYEPEYREVLYIAAIIYRSNPKRFEQLVMKDASRVIALNLFSFSLDIFPSEELIKQMLKDDDALLAAVGFYYAVWDLTKDVNDYIQRNRTPKAAHVKTKKAIDNNIQRHLQEFEERCSVCGIERKADLLFDYILSHRRFPERFGFWLMEYEMQDALLKEIEASGKIKSLKEVRSVARLIHGYSCKDKTGKCMPKGKYYQAVGDVLKRFLKERTGVYQWTHLEIENFTEICEVLPLKYQKKIRQCIEKETEKLMVSSLDEMVRHSIYLKDKSRWDIHQGMLRILDKLTIRNSQ